MAFPDIVVFLVVVLFTVVAIFSVVVGFSVVVFRIVVGADVVGASSKTVTEPSSNTGCKT